MVGTRFPSWPSDTANPRRGRPEPKILYQWTVPAGCGYACRIIETEPGIVQMQQRPLDIEAEAWETVPAAMGAANELIHLWAEVEDWRNSAQKAANEPCGDERHCACVGPLREELKFAHEAAELHIGIGARAIRARAEAEEQRDRWYGAAGQRQDELNEAHRALAWICGSLPFDRPDLPGLLRPPEFVTRQVKRAKAAYPTRLSTLDEWWRCPDCGPGVAADEDGCCANCGADLEIERRHPPHATTEESR